MFFYEYIRYHNLHIQISCFVSNSAFRSLAPAAEPSALDDPFLRVTKFQTLYRLAEAAQTLGHSFTGAWQRRSARGGDGGGGGVRTEVCLVGSVAGHIREAIERPSAARSAAAGSWHSSVSCATDVFGRLAENAGSRDIGWNIPNDKHARGL